VKTEAGWIVGSRPSFEQGDPASRSIPAIVHSFEELAYAANTLDSYAFGVQTVLSRLRHDLGPSDSGLSPRPGPLVSIGLRALGQEPRVAKWFRSLKKASGHRRRRHGPPQILPG
jgi:hypothetical protein